MAAAGHQIYESDFVNLAEIRIRHEVSCSDSALRVEAKPPHAGQREFAFHPVHCGTVGKLSNEQSSIGEFHDRTNLMESGHLSNPLDSRQSGKIDEAVLVAQREAAGRRAHSRPG